jgi:hypothetical protein
VINDHIEIELDKAMLGTLRNSSSPDDEQLPITPPERKKNRRPSRENGYHFPPLNSDPAEGDQDDTAS